LTIESSIYNDITAELQIKILKKKSNRSAFFIESKFKPSANSGGLL